MIIRKETPADFDAITEVTIAVPVGWAVPTILETIENEIISIHDAYLDSQLLCNDNVGGDVRWWAKPTLAKKSYDIKRF